MIDVVNSEDLTISLGENHQRWKQQFASWNTQKSNERRQSHEAQFYFRSLVIHDSQSDDNHINPLKETQSQACYI